MDFIRHMKNSSASKLNEQLKETSAFEVLKYFLENYKNRIALASSMGAEDQVLTEMIAKIDPSARIFTLDTGRVFPETYELIEKTNARYKINIEVFFPEREQVEKMVAEKGINLFYESIENRRLCCHIRKIVPLKRALKDLDVWISGLRRSQSITRNDIQMVEWDEGNQKIKINPLLNWEEEEVWAYIKANNIPYNTLHDQGFASIGCQPCTRALSPGEDIRAGRWWWENPDLKECGLHVKQPKID